MTAAELIAFEDEIAAAFAAGKIRGPIHLCGGNEEQLIEIFKGISRDDWVFSTYRNHYHALLHGIPREQVMAEVMGGRNMNLTSAAHRFFTSAIVGGTLPIAAGVAAALKRSDSPRKVWCFVGDMAATTGAFHEATNYAYTHGLPITFIVEDNGYSADSPTMECWGPLCVLETDNPYVELYTYTRTRPHAGIGRWVDFK
jgi:TPP-dependent pyruvate/acetoin dehydrogenase alpha subunit